MSATGHRFPERVGPGQFSLRRRGARHGSFCRLVLRGDSKALCVCPDSSLHPQASGAPPTPLLWAAGSALHLHLLFVAPALGGSRTPGRNRGGRGGSLGSWLVPSGTPLLGLAAGVGAGAGPQAELWVLGPGPLTPWDGGGCPGPRGFGLFGGVHSVIFLNYFCCYPMFF